jgi:Ca-activated chloride channel family protein
MMRFYSPEWFFLLLLLLLGIWVRLHWGRPGTLRFPWLAEVREAGRTWRQRLLWLPDALRLLALILVIVALARPQAGMEKLHETREGIAIEMVLDRSPSMQAPMDYGGRQLSRLETVKEVFAKFVYGDGHGLKGRPDDLVGMVVFSGVADTICPLTLSHEVFVDYLKTVNLPVVQAEQGTAIGDAVGLAAARLQKIGQPPTRGKAPDQSAGYQVKSRVMILLSDGSNNRGQISPADAAELALKWGVKIYAIGIGDPSTVDFGSEMDEATLKQLASRTGGRYWLATDGKVLEEICREIDRLEKTKVESTRHVDYRELFPRLIWLALALLVLEIGLRTTLLRRVP